MVDEKKQKELQNKYMEYQVSEQRIKQLQQQLEKMESQLLEVSAVEQSISEIGDVKEGEEILVPISGGVFFKTKLDNSSKFLVNVGSNVVVEKDVARTCEMVRLQGIEIRKYKEQVLTALNEQVEIHFNMEEELKKLVED
ncbi:prefoldin subunit alpha [Candidatus Woesearchaeota archaeon]|nr:prefoldin subunit alpha [Candidatus Woesearchaeota archaeon]